MNDRAVTESIGVILLVAVMVVISVTVGSAALVQTNAVRDQSDVTRINVKAEITDSSVTLRHVGGPSLDTDEVLFRLSGDDGRVGPYTLAQIDGGEANGTYLDTRDGTDTFDVGDEVTLNHSFTGYIDISLFDTESGNRLYHGLRSAGPTATDSAPPTAQIDSFDRVAEGYSITLDGSDSTDDGEVVSYSWEITPKVGSITEDDTSTPNATYDAPADVNGNQTVTIALTVTDDDAQTDTVTKTVTVVDVDTAQPPQDGGDGAAFDDPNGNGVYDPGEEVISKEELEDGFNDTSVDLVIYPKVGEVTSSGNNNPVDITANTITAGSDFRANGGTIQLTATGDVRIDGATLTAKGNEGISITSNDGRIFANETSMTVTGGGNQGQGPITFNSNGDIYLIGASLEASGYTADLGVSTATLYVEDLSLEGGGEALAYDPDDIAVNGTPSQGSFVEP